MRGLVSFITRTSTLTGKSYSTAAAKEAVAPGFRVTVRSRDMIKPSSPTPPHLRTVRLSLFDQLLAPCSHIPYLLFYQNNDPTGCHSNNHTERSNALKKSLSETLVEYYPLAGRIRGNVLIDCNDKGVEFCDAFVAGELKDAISNPNLRTLEKLFLPFEPNTTNGLGVGVQANYFSCGGMAVGVCVNHKVADGAASIAFLRAWAANSGADRGNMVDVNKETASFNGASILPPSEALNEVPVGVEVLKSDERVVSKRLIFNRDKIEELKAQAAPVGHAGKSNKGSGPTRVEVVTAFIWKRMMEAAATKAGFPEISSVVQGVDLRSRMVPKMKDSFTGNFVWMARTSPLVIGAQTEYSEMIHQLRKAFGKVDNNHMRNILSGDYESIKKEIAYQLRDPQTLVGFTSLCKFPLYEVDFGMGRPIWACLTLCSFKQTVTLTSTNCGRGVEAWIHMLEHHIDMLDL